MLKDNTQKTGAPIVLLIEDDTVLSRMYQTKFATEGLSVITAYDGEEGYKLASKGNISLMILDLMIPRLSGMDLLEKLRKTVSGKKIPVIVLTNLTDEGEKQKALKLGVREYLAKTEITPANLVEVIKKNLLASGSGNDKN